MPTDPATIADRADRLFDFAVTVTGCATPWIALNELFGAQTPTPWTTTTAQYRANTLALVRRLAERGAKPFVTIANPPYTGGDAAQWWRDLAAGGGPDPPGLLHRAEHPAAARARAGPREPGDAERDARARRGASPRSGSRRAGSRSSSSSSRRPARAAAKGCSRASKWLEIVKLQALAAQQVTRELRTHSIWSWGWATYSQAGIDPDKGEAVCVYLWVRDQNLCSGPGAAGPAMDASLTVGQLDQLRPAWSASSPPGRSARAPWRRSRGRSATGTSPTSVVLERLVLQQEMELDARAVLAAELAFVDDHFRGSLAVVPRRAQADPADADGRAGAAARRAAPRGRPGAVPAAERRARPRSRSSTSPMRGCRRASSRRSGRSTWLGFRTRGLAVETFAPARIFALPRRGRVRTIHGRSR